MTSAIPSYALRGTLVGSLPEKPVLTIGLSSSAAFISDFKAPDKIIKDTQLDQETKRRQLIDLHSEHMVANASNPMRPRPVIPFLAKMNSINQMAGSRLVDIVGMSHLRPEAGLRFLNSINAIEGFNLSSTMFTGGEPPWQSVPTGWAHLFLTGRKSDASQAILDGWAAATIIPPKSGIKAQSVKDFPDQIVIAFDFDGVLAGDESERIYKQQGLPAFQDHELQNMHQAMSKGPFFAFLNALCELRSHFDKNDTPIKICLVTARGGDAETQAATIRTLKTLKEWGLLEFIDAGSFQAGKPKAEVLAEMGVDFFFDDQITHCQLAADRGLLVGQVPFGISYQLETNQ